MQGPGTSPVTTHGNGKQGPRIGIDPTVEKLSTRDLLVRIVNETAGLFRTEIALGKAELRDTVASTKATTQRFGLAIGLAVLGIPLMVVTVVLLLALVVPAWAATLIVGAALLAGAGISAALAWRRRPTAPLERTRKTIKEDVKVMKESFA